MPNTRGAAGRGVRAEAGVVATELAVGSLGFRCGVGWSLIVMDL
jgi:hypothetical protein